MELIITKAIGVAGMLFFGIWAIVATKKYENLKEEYETIKKGQRK